MKKIVKVIPIVLSLCLIWLFCCTAISSSWSRIAAIQTIEPYAFAAHEQLMRNFSTTGSFAQTIHSGYDDKWTWSGHRALTLPIVAKVYGLDPSAQNLSALMIVLIALGALPAGALCMRTMRSVWGFLFGAFAYLIAPPTMALSLQDYQDLCLALPCLVFAMWAFSTGRVILMILGAFIGIAAREECVPLTIAIAFCMVPYKKRSVLSWIGRQSGPKISWFRWFLGALIGSIVSLSYIWFAEKYYPIATSGHDMPLQNAVASLGSGQIFLEGWLYRYRFYVLVWVPLGMLAIFAPLIALPGLALCLLHMTVPEGHGVDRSWSLHCHHMAPAVAFATASVALGGGRALRWLYSLPFGSILQKIVFCAALSWSGWWWLSWSEYYNLITTYKIEEPEWVHPVWDLLSDLPEDAVPLVSKKYSIAASHFIRSYTFDESLYSKEPHKGVSVATHIVYDVRREKVAEWIQRMPGYENLEEEYPFVLATWNSRSLDVGFRPRFSSIHAWTGPYNKGSDIPGVPPHEKRLQVRMNGSFPIIRLWNNPRPLK